MASYVPLWCKSNFSFLEGASHPDELIAQAVELELPALAITDRDGVYGVVRAHMAAQKTGLALIIGAEVTLEDASTLVLLAQNRHGYANLCRLLSAGRLRSVKGRSVVHWLEVMEHASGMVALWGGDKSLMVGQAEPDLVAHRLHDAFGGNLYALLTRHQRADEVRQEHRLRARAKRFGLATVASTEVLYHTPARRPLQDVLACIRSGSVVSQAGTLIKSNAEHALKSSADMHRLFHDDLAALERSTAIALSCRFSLAELRYRYPSERLPDGRSSSEHLRTLTYEGAKWRYGDAIPAAVIAQIEKELLLIDELDYCGYFLTMHEIVQFCNAKEILCQGRGSAANSVVCYCLGITAIDPIQLDLLFERFISRERAEAPDIDLDIEHVRREEVIQHVYEKYGRTHAAMVANIVRYRARSALRDVGKVLGIPETALERAAKVLSGHDEEISTEALAHAGLAPDTAMHHWLRDLATEILNFPRHLSIHPGGFLLGHEPVADFVPLENGAMEGRTVVQWDKNDLEDLGLFKVDLLALGALTQLHMCFSMIRAYHHIDLSMATLPADDAATYAMMCCADTVGVFQIESRAQMSMLPRLKPQRFYDLVIQVSIVRPGPITGGMVHPYLRRRNQQEAVEYPHPDLQPILEKTLGVPLFQEQVMKLAMTAADYTPGEADQLRRDMAAWRRDGRLEAHRERLIGRMLSKGIAPEFAESVFNQIRGFGSYGFPESHAASFALISYATSYVRCHYLLEFTCSLLNAQPMGFYLPATIIDDAKRHGLTILPIDVNGSDWNCSIVEHAGARALRMGLRYIKGLPVQHGSAIILARAEMLFRSVDDFIRRTPCDSGTLASLAEAGSFESLGLDRRSALWKIRALSRCRTLPLPFGDYEKSPTFAPLDWTATIAWDYQATQHSPRGHVLEPMRAWLSKMQWPTARQLNALSDGLPVDYVGVVICRQRPPTAKGVMFMTLEDETGFVNVVVWQKVYERFRIVLRTASFLGVSGHLQVQDNIVHVIAERLWEPQQRTKLRPDEKSTTY